MVQVQHESGMQRQLANRSMSFRRKMPTSAENRIIEIVFYVT